jgi:hypothetical protein
MQNKIKSVKKTIKQWFFYNKKIPAPAVSTPLSSMLRFVSEVVEADASFSDVVNPRSWRRRARLIKALTRKKKYISWMQRLINTKFTIRVPCLRAQTLPSQRCHPQNSERRTSAETVVQGSTPSPHYQPAYNG